MVLIIEVVAVVVLEQHIKEEMEDQV